MRVCGQCQRIGIACAHSEPVIICDEPASALAKMYQATSPHATTPNRVGLLCTTTRHRHIIARPQLHGSKRYSKKANCNSWQGRPAVNNSSVQQARAERLIGQQPSSSMAQQQLQKREMTWDRHRPSPSEKEHGTAASTLARRPGRGVRKHISDRAGVRCAGIPAMQWW